MLGVLAVDLFKQTDDYKTAAKAGYFLDHRFQKIKNYSGMSATDLSSPLLDPSGVVNHSHVNHQDMAFLAQAEQYDDIEAARKAVGAVFETIQSCSNGSRKPYGTLLYLRYIKYDFDTNVYNKMGYSSSHYYNLRREALCQFAEILPVKKLKYQYKNYDLLPDLLVYKSGDN